MVNRASNPRQTKQSDEPLEQWLGRQISRLTGAYWQLRTGGEQAMAEYSRSLSELAGKYGRVRIEGLVDRIIKQCGDMPAICDMPKFVPPVGEFKRCSKCQPDGWIFEEVPGKKLPVARRCKHEAA